MFPGFPFDWDPLPIADCSYIIAAVEAAKAELAKQQTR